jgi:ribosome recycling factor
MCKEIEKAILASDIGITPTNDGKSVRLVFPSLTEERRKELTKKTAKRGEDCKVAIRNIRREANDAAKLMKKNSEITEDDLKSAEKTIQDVTDKLTKEVDAVVARKDKEIMEI